MIQQIFSTFKCLCGNFLCGIRHHTQKPDTRFLIIFTYTHPKLLHVSTVPFQGCYLRSQAILLLIVLHTASYSAKSAYYSTYNKRRNNNADNSRDHCDN